MSVMVDDEDYERLSKFKWHTVASHGTRFYAARTVKINGKRVTVFMHRVIMGEAGECVDHKDNNSLNNQKANLRPCSYVENGRNRKLQKHSSKYKGVHFFKQTGKWMAYVRVNGKNVHLGCFANERDAALAYDAAATKHYGEFVMTNKQLGVL